MKIIKYYKYSWIFLFVDNRVEEDFFFLRVYGRRRLYSLLAFGMSPDKHSCQIHVAITLKIVGAWL